MSVIHYQKKEDMKFEAAGNGILRAEMLPGMVDGVHTYKCRVAAGYRGDTGNLWRSDTDLLLYQGRRLCGHTEEGV